MKDFMLLHEKTTDREIVLRKLDVCAVIEERDGTWIFYNSDYNAVPQKRVIMEKPHAILTMLNSEDIEEDKGLYIKIYALNSSQEVAEKLYQMYGANFLEAVREDLVEYIEARKEEEEE